MVVTPKQLADENNPVYLNEISQLEAQIDSWLAQHYTGISISPIPILIVDEPRKIVQQRLIDKYQKAGWSMSFESTEERSQVGIVIRELPYK